jgi:hypothetical protein
MKILKSLTKCFATAAICVVGLATPFAPFVGLLLAVLVVIEIEAIRNK